MAPPGLPSWRSLGIDNPDFTGRIINLSTRAPVGTGHNVMIGGFIIEDGDHQALIQALGPELVDRGISNVLADPVLTLTDISNQENPIELVVNDDWDADGQSQLITDLWKGNPPFEPGSPSSAIVVTLGPGTIRPRWRERMAPPGLPSSRSSGYRIGIGMR